MTTLRSPIVLLLLLLLAGATQIVAQTPAPPLPREAATPDMISVTGVGRARLTPDRVVFVVGVETVAPTAAIAMAQNSQSAARIIAELKKLGVRDTEVRTSHLGIQPQYEYQEGKRPRIVGYQVSNQVTVTRDDPSKVGELLQAAVDAGANQIHGISFTVADPARGRDEGLAAAFADARAKAQVLARAAGRTLGAAVAITEGGAPAVPPRPLGRERMVMLEAAKADVPVEAGAEELQFTVSVVFELR